MSRTPLEEALKILPKYYSCKNPKEALTWYFGKNWKTLLETSRILSEDWDDSVAWELHELVEACEYQKRRSSLDSPDWRTPEFVLRKKIPHQKALQVELKYLRDIGRLDLVKKRIRETKSLKNNINL